MLIQCTTFSLECKVGVTLTDYRITDNWLKEQVVAMEKKRLNTRLDVEMNRTLVESN